MSLSKGDNHGIEAYFTEAEFAQFSEYERLRMRNMKQNYEMMIQVGLNVPPPDFMRRPVRNKIQVSSSHEDKDGDGNSRLSGGTRARKNTSSFQVPLKDHGQQENKTKKPETISRPPEFDSDDAFEQLGDITIGASDESDTNVETMQPQKRKRMTKKEVQTETGTKRYLLREGTRKSYKDLETEDDDVYVYCEDCHELYADDCPSHPLTVIEDSPVPDKCKQRAKLSLPPGLELKEASIEGAGQGVWAQKFFPRGVRFGPYGGEIVVNEKVGRESGYSWEIFHDQKRFHFINGKNKSKANWMRYVNCARNVEQNLIAYQYLGQIYYWSFKPIYPGKELLVYYGEEYAKELGIKEDKFKDDGSCHKFEFCQLAFSGRLFLLKHLKYRHHQHVDLTLYQTKPSPALARSLCKVVASSAKNSTKTVRFHQSTFKDEKTKEGTGLNVKMGGKKQNGDKQYQCKICDKMLGAKSTLKTHVRIHTGENLRKCDTCGKGFTRKGSLDVHVRIPTGIKLYQCRYCNKTSADRTNLTKHERIHTGKRTYRCNTCGKQFNQKSNLTTHMRYHTGEKPYRCDTCGKGFAYKHHLTTHLRIHSGDKPFKCHMCNYGCNVSSNLTTHLRIHTGVKPYKCHICDYASSYSSHLKLHLRTHSGEKS